MQLLQVEQLYTNKQAQAQTPLTQTHRPPSKEPESGDNNNGWRLDDTRQLRTPTSQIHSNHGRALFAQAWQRSLQGTSETDETGPPPEHPPPGSTYSCYICRGVDIRRTCDPPAGGGTETDIPTAKRSPWCLETGTMQEDKVCTGTCMHRRSTDASKHEVSIARSLAMITWRAITT